MKYRKTEADFKNFVCHSALKLFTITEFYAIVFVKKLFWLPTISKRPRYFYKIYHQTRNI